MWIPIGGSSSRNKFRTLTYRGTSRDALLRGTDGEARTDMSRVQLAQARTCLGHPGNRALQNDRPPALNVPRPGLRITCVEDVESQNVTGSAALVTPLSGPAWPGRVIA